MSGHTNRKTKQMERTKEYIEAAISNLRTALEAALEDGEVGIEDGTQLGPMGELLKAAYNMAYLDKAIQAAHKARDEILWLGLTQGRNQPINEISALLGGYEKRSEAEQKDETDD